MPAIDPFASKNAMLPAYLARKTVAELGVDLYKPLMIQVSPFDPWKDPHRVVDIWRRVREVFPDLQLALVGAMADDDPEGWRIYEDIERETHEEPNCGIPAQVEDGITGYLAGSVDEFAERVRELLENPDRARELGATGALRVRERFLLTRLLRDHLTLLKRALAA